MTAQQIDYWKLQEQKRANIASENENVRYHKANETLQTQINAETNRHNLAVESINRWSTSVAERNAAINALNAQTNARMASLQEKRDAETARHNLVLEGIQSDYNTAIIALEGKKLQTNVEMNEANIGSREDVAKLGMAGGIIGAGISAGSGLVRDFVRYTSGAKAIGATVGAATSAGAAGTASKTLGRTIGSTAGAVGAGLMIPAAMVAGGLLIGGTLAKNNVAYPFNTKGMKQNDFNKEVRWYGAE